jgi:hypothetical protein
MMREIVIIIETSMSEPPPRARDHKKSHARRLSCASRNPRLAKGREPAFAGTSRGIDEDH